MGRDCPRVMAESDMPSENQKEMMFDRVPAHKFDIGAEVSDMLNNQLFGFSCDEEPTGEGNASLPLGRDRYSLPFVQTPIFQKSELFKIMVILFIENVI